MAVLSNNTVVANIFSVVEAEHRCYGAASAQSHIPGVLCLTKGNTQSYRQPLVLCS